MSSRVASQRCGETAVEQEVADFSGVVADVPLVGQVESGDLQDGEEEGDAQAFGQGSDRHEQDGGE